MQQSLVWTKVKFLLTEMKSTWRIAGVKGLYRKYGLKLFILFFCYYLIRDLTLYIFIPWIIAQKVLQ